MSKVVCREIIEYLMNTRKIRNLTKKDVNLAKRQVAGKYRIKRVPRNSELIHLLKSNEKEKLLPYLRRKNTRIISGVTVIAVVTKPHPCPHGKCAYCPGGPQVKVPSAYVGREPAIMRGIQHKYNPFLQVKNRIRQLQAIGHTVDKVEIIVMGGTYNSLPLECQERFIKRCLEALTNMKATTLEQAKQHAETSMIRNVGITLETRPDWAKGKHIKHMLSIGVTRVELGVQNIYDDIYELVDRGHSVKDVVDATRVLKDSGLKVGYHLMPGLPGSSFMRDLTAFKKIFRESIFKPDMIKIYPCLILKGTKVFDWWKKGEYNPFTNEDAIRLLLEVKKFIPPWVRIMRIQRDIPASLIEAGVNRSNLRQIIHEKLKEKGLKCHCIRCREVGQRWLKDEMWPDPHSIALKVTKEKASEGIDVFISAEDSPNDILIGYLRLRIPSTKFFRPEISEASSIVRELHVYGPLVPVGTKLSKAWQHKGYGRILLSEAERLSQEEYDKKKILITSALGTKQYYMKTGYNYDGPYLSKIF